MYDVSGMPRAVVVIVQAQILRSQLPPTVLLYVLISTSVVRKKGKSFYLFKFFDISRRLLSRKSSKTPHRKNVSPHGKQKINKIYFLFLQYSRDKKSRND